MNFNNNNIEEIVNFINKQRHKRKLEDIARKNFKMPANTLEKHLIKHGYILINNQYHLANEITLNAAEATTNDITTKGLQVMDMEIETLKDNLHAKRLNKELLNCNKQLIEMLLTQKNLLEQIEGIEGTTERTFINETASYRVDTGIQKRLKEVSNKHLITLKDLVNNALYEYLKKFDK